MSTLTVYHESRVPYFAMRQCHISRLRAALPETRVIWCRTKRGFLRVLPQTDVVVAWAFRQEWFERAPRLNAILSSAAGRDFYKLDPPTSVTLRYGTFHGTLMAESVLGMMLSVNRGLYAAYRAQMHGDLWPQPELHQGLRLLHGSHAVILGFGHIGRKIGEYLKPFGVRVTGVRRSRRRAPKWFGRGDRSLTMEGLDNALTEADHLIMVLPSDTGTDNLMDKRRLALLPRRAVIYNVGRGNSIDEEALARSLQRGELRGACLDVFAQEPLEASSPLSANLPGLVRLPHATAFAQEYLERFLDEIIPVLRHYAYQG